VVNDSERKQNLFKKISLIPSSLAAILTTSQPPTLMYNRIMAFFVFLICRVTYSFGQDTLLYCQMESSWCSNCFYFIKSDKQSSHGKFKKLMFCDDGQEWEGVGNFIETDKYLLLDSIKLVKTKYHLQGDTLIKNNSYRDTSDVKQLKLFKNGDNLIYYANNIKWWKKKEQTIYSKREN